MMGSLFFASLAASGIGAVCGIGGGVIIKPTLDFFRIADASTASFLSSCAVFAMAVCAVGSALAMDGGGIDLKRGTPLAMGAVGGGGLGSALFLAVRTILGRDSLAGAAQAGGLFLLTLGTLIYTLMKDRIRTRRAQGVAPCLGIGLALGAASSFLGIGGGPVNLVMFRHFFSLDAKEAAPNSLYVVLFGQLAGLIHLAASGSIPPFEPFQLAAAVFGGVLGAAAGRLLNRRLTYRNVDRFFLAVMVGVACLCLRNFWLFTQDFS